LNPYLWSRTNTRATPDIYEITEKSLQYYFEDNTAMNAVIILQDTCTTCAIHKILKLHCCTIDTNLLTKDLPDPCQVDWQPTSRQ
jgi:hypothetical protein